MLEESTAMSVGLLAGSAEVDILQGPGWWRCRDRSIPVNTSNILINMVHTLQQCLWDCWLVLLRWISCRDLAGGGAGIGPSL